MGKKSHKVVPPLKIKIRRDSSHSSVAPPPLQPAARNSTSEQFASTSQQNDVVEESLPGMEEEDISPLDIMTRANASMASDLTKAREDLRDARDEISELRAKMNEAAVNEALLRTKIASLNSAKNSLQVQLNNAALQERLLREEIGAIEKEMQSLQEQLTVVTEEKRVLEQSLNKEITELAQQKKVSTAEIERLKDLLQQEQNKRLRERQEFVDERKAWLDEAENMRQKAAAMTKAMENLQLDLDREKSERNIEKLKAEDKISEMEKEKAKNEKSTEAMWQQIGASIATGRADNPAVVRGLSQGLHHQLASTGSFATLMENKVNNSNDDPSASAKDRVVIPRAHYNSDSPTTYTSSSCHDGAVKRRRSGDSEGEGKRFLKKE